MRMVHDTIDQLAEEIKNKPHSRQHPYKVVFDGVVKYTMSGNSDQAIAAVARDLGVAVESIPISSLIINQALAS
jgi:hypothetical protein